MLYLLKLLFDFDGFLVKIWSNTLEVRTDLMQVSPYISRLINFGNECREYERQWSHLKNNEDYRIVFGIDDEKKRRKLEDLYAEGRGMASGLSEILSAINYDFSKYPTLTSIVEKVGRSLGYYNSIPDISESAEKICIEEGLSIWAVDQMVSLCGTQMELVGAIRSTLRTLQNSDIYRMENGMPSMKQEANISVSGISGSSININSSGATASVSSTYSEPSVFPDLISAIRNADLESEVKVSLLADVEFLASSHKSGKFYEAYKTFMNNISSHITIFGSFIPALSALL